MTKENPLPELVTLVIFLAVTAYLSHAKAQPRVTSTIQTICIEAEPGACADAGYTPWDGGVTP